MSRNVLYLNLHGFSHTVMSSAYAAMSYTAMSSIILVVSK